MKFSNLEQGQVFAHKDAIFRKEEGNWANCIAGGEGEQELDDANVKVLKFNTWFDTFLKEKNLPYCQWTLTDQHGMEHHINSEVVIETIHICPDHEQKGIKDMIVKIDFHNGDVNDYFKHLAQGLVNTHTSY